MSLPATQRVYSTPLGLLPSSDLIPRVSLGAINVEALTGFMSL
jgi:hypothetical protein